MADDVTRVVLDNGFTVFVRENQVAPVVAVAMPTRVPTGTAPDPPGTRTSTRPVAAFAASTYTSMWPP